jgi:hypothetical protein
MDIFNSFQIFEDKFGKGETYSRLTSSQVRTIKDNLLPNFYVDYIESNGLKEFKDGFWWFVNPLELSEELSFVAHDKECFPVIRNAFGGFIVFLEGDFYVADIQTNSFVLLGDELGVIFNVSLTDDYALRDIHYAEFFDYAFAKFGKLKPDEIYTFIPSPMAGGEFKNGNIQIVKLREHLCLLSQL